MKVFVLLLWLVSVPVCSNFCSNNYGVSDISCPANSTVKITRTCPSVKVRSKSLVPCARVCRPRDCLFLSKLDRESLTNQTRNGVVAKKIDCVGQVEKKSRKRGCYNETKFAGVSQELLDKTVNRYHDNRYHGNTSNRYHDNTRVVLEKLLREEYVVGGAGVVAIPALLNHHRFSLCFDFSLSIPFEPGKLMSLISFNMTAEGWPSFQLFTIVCHRNQIRFMTYYDSFVLFKTPFEIKPGDKISLCVSYEAGPPVRLDAWIRSDAQPLVKLQPSRLRWLHNYKADLRFDYLLGALVVGEPVDDWSTAVHGLPGCTVFQGSIGRLRLSDRYLSNKRKTLAAIRGDDMSMEIMTGRLAAGYEMSRWRNHTHQLKVWTETEISGNITTALAPPTQDLCLACQARCLSLNSTCQFLRSCASCEEMYCAGYKVKHYQRSYESVSSCHVTETNLTQCNETSLTRCFKKSFTRCEDINVMIECVQQIDLDSCSWYMIDWSLDGYVSPFTQCKKETKRWVFLLNLIPERRMSACGSACVVDSGLIELMATPFPSPRRFLKMRDNRELCGSVNSYRSCVVENSCPERNFSKIDHGKFHSRYSWIHPTIERLHRIQQHGCLIPRECKVLLNSTSGQETLRNVEKGAHLLPKRGRDLTAHNAHWTSIPLPTPKELQKCRQRAEGKANATLILTPKQVKENRRNRNRNRRSGAIRIIRRNETEPRDIFEIYDNDF